MLTTAGDCTLAQHLSEMHHLQSCFVMWAGAVEAAKATASATNVAPFHCCKQYTAVRVRS